MNYIIDTHVLLWAMFDTDKISESTMEILLDNRLYKFVCVVSIWEIVIKKRGKLPLTRIFRSMMCRGFGD